MIRELFGTSKLAYDGKEETLEYYILNHKEEEEKNDRQHYGIEIVKRGAEKEERSLVTDLTTNKVLAEHTVKVCMEHTVTPIHLYDVLENILE